MIRPGETLPGASPTSATTPRRRTSAPINDRQATVPGSRTSASNWTPRLVTVRCRRPSLTTPAWMRDRSSTLRPVISPSNSSPASTAAGGGSTSALEASTKGSASAGPAGPISTRASSVTRCPGRTPSPAARVCTAIARVASLRNAS